LHFIDDLSLEVHIGQSKLGLIWIFRQFHLTLHLQVFEIASLPAAEDIDTLGFITFCSRIAYLELPRVFVVQKPQRLQGGLAASKPRYLPRPQTLESCTLKSVHRVTLNRGNTPVPGMAWPLTHIVTGWDQQ